MGWNMVYNFLGKDEKTWRNLYLLSLKTSLWKEVRHFSVQCIHTNKNHVTNQPVITGSQNGERSGLVVECSN